MSNQARSEAIMYIKLEEIANFPSDQGHEDVEDALEDVLGDPIDLNVHQR